MDRIVRRAVCQCGKVQFEGVGEPILTGVCYCDDCQAGGRQIEALPGAPPVLDSDGGTSCLVYRVDRFSCVAGEDLLKPYKIRERTMTRRYVASCCNSGMYTKFGPGHWYSVYRARFEGDLPAIEMRNQTRYRTATTPIPDDAPNYRRFPLRLFAKLIGAKLAMMIGR